MVRRGHHGALSDWQPRISVLTGVQTEGAIPNAYRDTVKDRNEAGARLPARTPGDRARGPAGLTRRRFATLAAAAPAAVGATSTPGSEVDALRRVSATLTGFPAASLDIRFAASLLRALRNSDHRAAVDALIRGEDVRDSASLQTAIVSAWYSGLLPGETGPTTATVRGALVWSVLDFASPPGTCATGAPWSEPPSGETQ